MKQKSAALARHGRVYIRHATLDDQRIYLKAVRASREFIDPWGVPPHTPAQYRKFLNMKETMECARYFIFSREDDALAGMINLNDIIRYKVDTCYMGYMAFAPYHGQGYLTEGMRLALRHAFTKLKLHRIVASIQPRNVRSITLVDRVGFHFEGIARRLVKINNRWKDHEQWAILREEWKGKWKRPTSPLKTIR